MSVSIPNYQVQPLLEFLFNMELSGRQSRMRTRLIRLLEDHLVNEIQAENKILLDECAEKDENGEFVYNQATGMIALLPHKAEEYHREYEDLMKERFYLEINDKNVPIITEIYHILDTNQSPLSGQLATFYDEWCDIFEEAAERCGVEIGGGI